LQLKLILIAEGVAAMNMAFFRSNSGYTFIELLIALTILSFVVAPFLGLFGGSFSAISAAGRQSAAINLCREKIETTKADGYDAVNNHFITSANNPLIETEIPAMPGYRRVTSVCPIEIDYNGDQGIPLKLLHISVTVSWTLYNKNYSETVESYLGQR
jgi:prepilin-type N-terminal cleavage/methylation domain-containing protein